MNRLKKEETFTPLRYSEQVVTFQEQLLNWFDQHHRELPWRDCASPYETWVSEIMLQQTQVATVIPYFKRWMETFPTIEHLAEASEEEVMNLWEGLGYYRRARFIHETAQFVVRSLQGEFPSNARELKKLKGIGPYTAGAIASIAFGERVSAVDGNVIRVMARLMALEGVQPKRASAATTIAQHVEPLISESRPGDFNQALMELGATTCRPLTPNCDDCPVTSFCIAFHKDETSFYPEVGEKTEVRKSHAELAIIQRNHQGVTQYLVEQRPKDALLGRTWQFPMSDHVTSLNQFLNDLKKRGIEITPFSHENEELSDFSDDHFLGTIAHRFSHIDMTIHVRIYRLLQLHPDAQVEWLSLDSFQDRPVARAIRKVEELLRVHSSYTRRLPGI